MNDIGELRARVAAAERQVGLNDERYNEHRERIEHGAATIDRGLRRMRAEIDRYKARVERFDKENAELRGMLDRLLCLVEGTSRDQLDVILQDLDAALSGLLDSVQVDEPAPEDESGPPRAPAVVAPVVVTVENTADGKSAKTAGKMETATPARPETAPVDIIFAEELSVRAIAELWSRESCHAPSDVEAELLAAFQEKLKGCSMDACLDATISRDDLITFCDEAHIAPPRFWARVA
jgi:hypothetical protein